MRDGGGNMQKGGVFFFGGGSLLNPTAARLEQYFYIFGWKFNTCTY